MTELQPKHPTTDQLADYARGILDEADDQQIEEHLSKCDKCCETLNGLPEDTFVAMLRKEDPNPAAEPTMAAEDPGTSEDRSLSSLPAELADHPRYRILELIGKGGMGAVYKAEHRMMQRTVALKLINPRLINQPGAVERFRREVKAAAKLAHPNIVTAHDAEQVGDLHFLIMEYVEGTDLSEVVKQRGRLPVDQACDYIRQAALGLQHAYERGMVHRDIKPHNLMVLKSQESRDKSRNSRETRGKSQEQDRDTNFSGSRLLTLDSGLSVKILDFGLASFATETIVDADDNSREDEQAASAQLTMAGAMMGTPDFMSPEQADDARSADVRSDIYALGTTLYYLLAGHPPFTEGTVMQKLEAHRHDSPKPISSIRADVPAELADVIRRMMAKYPAERYQTPAEVADALAPFVDRHRSHSKPPTQESSSRHHSGSRIARRSIWHRIAVTATLLLLLGAAGAVYYITTDKGTLQIEPVAADVEVVLRQNGEIVEIIDSKTDSRVLRLPTGKYEVELKGNANEFTLSKNEFVLRRGERVIVRVKHISEVPYRQEANKKSVLLREFGPSVPTITRDGVVAEEGGWRIDAKEDRTVRLFEQPISDFDDGLLVYRAKVKTKNVTDRAYLEMWVRLPGKGEFFSKGLHNPVRGTKDWAEYEIPFLLQKGQYPDLVKLNLIVEGGGIVWVKDVELHASFTASNPKALEDRIRAITANNSNVGGEDRDPDLVGFQYVTQDFMAAVVVHPQQIMKKSIADSAKLLLSVLSKRDLGVAINDVEQVLLLFPSEPPSKPRPDKIPDLAAVYRLNPRLDAKTMVERILPEAERLSDGQAVFYIDRQGMAVFAPDSRTIVRGPRDLLLRMSASSEANGLLADALRVADLDNDLVGVVANTGIARQGLFVLAAMARPKLPPDLANEIGRVPDAMMSATLAADLGPDSPISLTVQATNQEAAEMLERLGRRALVETQRTLANMGPKRAPSETLDTENLVLISVFELLGKSKITRRGDHIVISSTTPSGFADATLTEVVKRAEDATRQARLSSKLKQVGVAMHNYHDAHKSFPPGRHLPADQFDKDGRPLLSWRVHLLPYLSENADLWKRFRFDEPWDSEHNIKLLGEMPDVFKTTDDPTKTTIMSVAGPGTVYEGKQGVRLADITDGTANTILAVVAGDDKAVPWTKPEDLPLIEHDPIIAFGKIPSEEFLAIFCDGSLQKLHKQIEPVSLHDLLIRNDGRRVDREKRRPK